MSYLHSTTDPAHAPDLRFAAQRRAMVDHQLIGHGISDPRVLEAMGRVPRERFVPPELREDHGEFAVAEKGKLPKLIEWTDLKGSLHNHTTWSDGHNTLEETAAHMEELGLQYWAVTDHSRAAFQANGLDEKRVRDQIKAITALNKKLADDGHDFRLLTGSEVDVLKDGLDLPDDLPMTLRKLLMAINATTAADVVVRDLRTVPEDFHARHSAIRRQYRYTITTERTALERQFVWAVRGQFDAELAKQAAMLLHGELDFTSFSKRSNDVRHYRCHIMDAHWEFTARRAEFVIAANRFVRGMVRALVGGIMQVAQGKMTLETFERLIHEPQDLDRAKYVAPAHGLVLEAVTYPERFGLWTDEEMMAR